MPVVSLPSLPAQFARHFARPVRGLALLTAAALVLGGLAQTPAPAAAADPPAPEPITAAVPAAEALTATGAAGPVISLQTVPAGVPAAAPAGVAPDLTTLAHPFLDADAGITLDETTPAGTLWTVSYPGGNSVTAAPENGRADTFRFAFALAAGYVATGWTAYQDEDGASPYVRGGVSPVDGDPDAATAAYTIPAALTAGLWFGGAFFTFGPAAGDEGPLLPAAGAAAGEFAVGRSPLNPSMLVASAPPAADGYLFGGFEYQIPTTGRWTSAWYQWSPETDRWTHTATMPVAADTVWRAVYFSFTAAAEAVVPAGAAASEFAVRLSDDYANRVKLSTAVPADGHVFVEFQQSVDGGAWTALSCLTAPGAQACRLTQQVDGGFILDNVPLTAPTVFRARYFDLAGEASDVYPAEASAGRLTVQTSPNYPARLLLTAPAPAPGWFFNYIEYESASGDWAQVTSNGFAVQQPDGTFRAEQVTPAASGHYRARYSQMSVDPASAEALELDQGPYWSQVAVTVAVPEGKAIGKLEYAVAGAAAKSSLYGVVAPVEDRPGFYRTIATYLPVSDLVFSVTFIDYGLDADPVIPAAAASEASAVRSPANASAIELNVTPDDAQDHVFDGWYRSVYDAAAADWSGWTRFGASLSIVYTPGSTADGGQAVRFQARFFSVAAAASPGGTFTLTRYNASMVRLDVVSTVDDDTGAYAFTRWEASVDGGQTWSDIGAYATGQTHRTAADTLYRAVFTAQDAPFRLTLVQDESKGQITVWRNGASQAVLSVVSVQSDPAETWAYAFARWQQTTAANPQEADWTDISGAAGTNADAGAFAYTADTSFRAVFVRAAVTVAADSVGQGHVRVAADPDYPVAVVVTATPADGVDFDRWEASVDGGQTWTAARGRVNVPGWNWMNNWLWPAEYSVRANVDTLYRARFIDPATTVEPLLTVQPAEGGAVTVTPVNSEAFVLTPSPDSDYILVGWQSKAPEALLWQQATWYSYVYDPYAIRVQVADEQPVLYRARFAKADSVQATFKTDPDAKGGLRIGAIYSAQIFYPSQVNNVNLLSADQQFTTIDGRPPSTDARFTHGNLADKTVALPADVPFAVSVEANTDTPTILENYFDAENYVFVGFRVNGELVTVAGYDADRGDDQHLLGSLAGGRLTYMLAKSYIGGWYLAVTNTDVAAYAADSYFQTLPPIPAGTPATGFTGGLVIEPVFVHKGDAETVAPLDRADVESARRTLEAVAAWSAPQPQALSAGELRDWLTAEISRLQLSGVAATVELAEYTPALWGEDGAAGADGAFEFTVTLAKGETADTLAGLAGVIVWAAKPPATSLGTVNVVADHPARGVVGAERLGGTLWRVTGQPGDGWILDGWESTPSADPGPDAVWTPVPGSRDLRLQTVEVEFDVTYRAIFAPGLVTLAGDGLRVVRAVDGVSVSGGPYAVGGGAGTSCPEANANYLSGHALPMIKIEEHHYVPRVTGLSGCAAGPDQVSAYDNVVLWFPISHATPISGPVEVAVYGGPDLDQPLGAVGWTDLETTAGVVIVPVDSLPPGEQAKVVLTVAGQPPAERVYDLAAPPSTDKGLLAERAAAVAELRQLYQAGLARNAEGTSATGQFYSSRFLMLNEEYPHAVTAIAEVEGAEALAEARAYWSRVLDEAGRNIFSTGVTLNAGGSVVTVPESGNILMAMTAAAEQTSPGTWRLSTGYNGGWINGWRQGGWGQITDDGQQGGATYLVYDRACVEASSGSGAGVGYFGDACPYTNGVMAQRVYITAEPSDGLFSTFGAGDGVVQMSWLDPDEDAPWPAMAFAWPGTMGWALGDLRQAFDDADLQTHEAYVAAIAHQNPWADGHGRAWTDLRVEFLDFLFRKDAAMTEAAKTVVRAIAALDAHSTQPDREVILSAYDRLTTAEKAAVFNYEELSAWPPRGAGFAEVSVTVTGSAADLVPSTTGFPVRYSYPAFGAEPAESGVLLPRADGVPDRTGLLPVGAELTFQLGELPAVTGVVWGQPSLSVSAWTVAEGEILPVTVTVDAQRLTLPDADPDALANAAAWLAGQLAAHDGVLPGMSPQDWGLTEDAILALAAAGVGGDLIEASTAKLLASGDAYVGPADAPRWNQIGKTILVLQVVGRDPAAWPADGGARDLVAELRAAVGPSGQFGGEPSGNVFAFQQALSLVALARTSDG
ncbi:MAG: hypothetical protein LBH76_08850, partial [Propionibacteriaceae bacterium]|nr:hypothetical protein [Propionibacteriaceae bacterium]